MGKIIFSENVTLDGVIEDPAGAEGFKHGGWVGRIMDGRFVPETTHGECATPGKTFVGMGFVGYDSAQNKFSVTKVCGLCGTVSSGLVNCGSSGSRFECVKDECCPVTAQKIKARDEVVIESNDRIVLTFYKTINEREVKVGKMVTIRQN